MLLAVIIVGIIVVLEVGWFLWGLGKAVDTKTDLLEFHWAEFLDFVQDSRKIQSVQDPYEFWKEMKDGHVKYVPLANEHNFWQWYLDYKWENPNVAKRRKGKVSK